MKVDVYAAGTSRPDLDVEISVSVEAGMNKIFISHDLLRLTFILPDLVEVSDLISFFNDQSQKRFLILCELEMGEKKHTGKRKLRRNKNLFSLSIGGLRVDLKKDSADLLLKTAIFIQESYSKH